MTSGARVSTDARSEVQVVERLWYGEGRAARAARLGLVPLELLYRAAVGARGRLFDLGLLRSVAPDLPALSVGNLTVGGTGKTPVAAWLAGALRRRGAHPAIVLRGYGADEPLVHAVLNPDVPVVADADRVSGIATAHARGADVAVLDDAFQHRRARRVADVVLLSADRWTARRRHLLPVGPWREPLSALRRASLLLVTRKAADAARARTVLDAASAVAPAVPGAVVYLAAGDLHAVAGAGGSERAPLPFARLAGATVFAVSAIGDAGAFHAQLVRGGARLDPPPAAYPDHFAYGADDAGRLAREGERADYVVCTLKDAVKLAPLWPRVGPTVWYVSQRVILEVGAPAVEHVLDTVLAARRPEATDTHPRTAGPGRLTDPAHGHRPPPADR
jgi:tetraacyldisaccharide 4'-kinase